MITSGSYGKLQQNGLFNSTKLFSPLSGVSVEKPALGFHIANTLQNIIVKLMKALERVHREHACPAMQEFKPYQRVAPKHCQV